MKIAIIGFGSIGKRHYKNITTKFNDDVFVCSKRKDLPKKIKQVKTIEECVIEKPDIAFITNETDLHVKTALRLADNGCHLFIEKPLSHSLKNIKKLKSLVKKKKIITQIGCNLRYNPCLVKIKELIEKEKIGQVISFYSENGSFLPDWHPDEDYTKTYAAKKKKGGSVVLTSIHEIDYLYWFFGKVSEVSSNTGKFSELKITSDDYSATFLKFKNGIIGEMHLDYFQRPKTRTCKIIGTKGSIFWNNEDNTVKIFQTSTKKLKTVYKLKKFDINKMYIDEIIHFRECIKKNKSTINDITQGIETLKIAICALKSSENKRVVKI